MHVARIIAKTNAAITIPFLTSLFLLIIKPESKYIKGVYLTKYNFVLHTNIQIIGDIIASIVLTPTVTAVFNVIADKKNNILKNAIKGIPATNIVLIIYNMR